MPTYLPPISAITQSEAFAEAAHFGGDDAVFFTLAFYHPLMAEPVYVVNDFDPLTATLEADAPVDGGNAVTFQPVPMAITLPTEDDARTGEVRIEVGNVSRLLMPHLAAVATSQDPVEVICRIYLASDLTAPHETPPLRVVLRQASATATMITALAGFGDIANRKFPAIDYKRRKAPVITPVCWTIDGRLGTSLGGYYTYKTFGKFSQELDGLDMRGTYLANYGALRFDDQPTFADGDIVFSAAHDWNTNLGGALGGSLLIAFGDAAPNGVGPAPANDFENFVLLSLSGSATNGVIGEFRINGTSTPAGVTTNNPFTWGKVFVDFRLTWQNGVGVRLYANDVLVYEALDAAFSFDDAPIYFGSHGTYSVTDGWLTIRDITACRLIP